jgi:hypothetical protein
MCNLHASCSVDGALLVELTDEQLKKDLGILPLGHRQTLMNKIKASRAQPLFPRCSWLFITITNLTKACPEGYGQGKGQVR